MQVEKKERIRKDRDVQFHRGKPGGKLRGRPTDSEETRISKTLSWILRHGSQSEGLAMRTDGYAKVDDLLKLPKMRSVDFPMLQQIVEKDNKKRFTLFHDMEASAEPPTETWWIRANQGHSMKAVVLDLKSVDSVVDIPGGIAVHGTTRHAWESIREQGLSKMKRNHIHLAQGIPGDGVISGMRKSSQILIFIDVQKALDAGIKFYLSDNGVVLTEGDSEGYLRPQYFARVETSKREAIPGWGTPESQEKTQRETMTQADASSSGEVAGKAQGTVTELEQEAKDLVI